jgi:hypothetical protein
MTVKRKTLDVKRREQENLSDALRPLETFHVLPFSFYASRVTFHGAWA